MLSPIPKSTGDAFNFLAKETTIGIDPPSRINTVFFSNTFDKAMAAAFVALSSNEVAIGYAP